VTRDVPRQELWVVSDLKGVFMGVGNQMMKRTLRFGLLPAVLALAGHVRADDQPGASTPDVVASLRADNKQLSDELASAWKESEKLKADLATAQAASAKSADEATDLQKQLDAAKAQPAAAETPTPAPAAEASPDLADAQEKLATALRSFTVVQDENATLRDSVDKLTSENASLTQQLDLAHSSITSLQAQAAATSQIEPLRNEVRQGQDEVSRLAIENGELRTRLSLQSPSPGSTMAVPMRPDAVRPEPISTPAPQASAPAPAAPAAKTYVVAEGDTLGKISRKFYGTSSKWQDILKANKGVVKNETSLVVGSTLTIP
jgi:nucleoid-associated protein YgaU